MWDSCRHPAYLLLNFSTPDHVSSLHRPPAALNNTSIDVRSYASTAGQVRVAPAPHPIGYPTQTNQLHCACASPRAPPAVLLVRGRGLWTRLYSIPVSLVKYFMFLVLIMSPVQWPVGTIITSNFMHQNFSMQCKSQICNMTRNI